MSDYELYYWPVPFRGQFVRALLAYAGKTWTEGDIGAMSELMEGPVKTMPVPFMGPPMLIDKKADVVIAQMPAIMLYLGETLDLIPATPALRAMTMKIVLAGFLYLVGRTQGFWLFEVGSVIPMIIGLRGPAARCPEPAPDLVRPVLHALHDSPAGHAGRCRDAADEDRGVVRRRARALSRRISDQTARA